MDADEPVLRCADKLAFDSARAAKTAATVALYQHGTKLQIYQCRDCSLWHLASTYDE